MKLIQKKPKSIKSLDNKNDNNILYNGIKNTEFKKYLYTSKPEII
jgi:hypothetical protein